MSKYSIDPRELESKRKAEAEARAELFSDPEYRKKAKEAALSGYEEQVKKEAEERIKPDLVKSKEEMERDMALMGVHPDFTGPTSIRPSKETEAEHGASQYRKEQDKAEFQMRSAIAHKQHTGTEEEKELSEGISKELYKHDIEGRIDQRMHHPEYGSPGAMSKQVRQGYYVDFMNERIGELMQDPEFTAELATAPDNATRKQMLRDRIDNEFMQSEHRAEMESIVENINKTPQQREAEQREAVRGQINNLKDAIADISGGVAEEDQGRILGRYAEMTEGEGKDNSIANKIFGPLGRSHAMAAASQEHTTETDKLQVARKYIKSAEFLINENDKKDGSKLASAGRAFAHHTFDPDTWSYGMAELRDSGIIDEIAERYLAGEEISEADQKLMDALALSLATEYYFDDPNRGMMWGSIAGQSTPFMVEFMLNPFASAGKGVTRAIGRYGIKRFGSKAAQRGMRVIGAIGGDLVSAAALQATTGLAKTIEDVSERHFGSHTFDVDPESGDIVYAGREGGQSLGTAIQEGVTAQLIEYFSEMGGERFGEVAGLMGLTKTGKFIGNKYHASAIGKFFGKLQGSPVYRTIREMERRAQWSGTIGEYAEEVYGTILNSMFVGDEQFSDLLDVDEQVDTFMGLLLSGGAMSAVRTTGYVGDRANSGIQLRKANQAAAEHIDNWDTVKDAIDNMTIGERTQLIRELAGGQLTTDKAFMDAMARVRNQMTSSEHRAADSDINKAMQDVLEQFRDKAAEEGGITEEGVQFLMKYQPLFESLKGKLTVGARRALADYVGRQTYHDALTSTAEERIEQEKEMSKAQGVEALNAAGRDRRATTIAKMEAEYIQLDEVAQDLKLDEKVIEAQESGEIRPYWDIERGRHVEAETAADIYAQAFDKGIIHEEEYGLLMDRENAKARVEGITEQIEAEARETIKPTIDFAVQYGLNETGDGVTLLNIGTNENPQMAFLKKGHIEIDQQGYVDAENSDNTVWIADMTGEMKQIPADEVFTARSWTTESYHHDLLQDALNEQLEPLYKKVRDELGFDDGMQVEYLDRQGRPKVATVANLSENVVGVTDMEGKTETYTNEELQDALMTEEVAGVKVRDMFPVYIDGVEYEAHADHVGDGKVTLHIPENPNASEKFMTVEAEQLAELMNPENSADSPVSQMEQAQTQQQEAQETTKKTEKQAENETAPSSEDSKVSEDAIKTSETEQVAETERKKEQTRKETPRRRKPAEPKPGDIRYIEPRLGEYISLEDYIRRSIATRRVEFFWNDQPGPGSTVRRGLKSELFGGKAQVGEHRTRIGLLSNERGLSIDEFAHQIWDRRGEEFPASWAEDDMLVKDVIIDILLREATPTSMIEAAQRQRRDMEGLSEWEQDNMATANMTEAEAADYFREKDFMEQMDMLTEAEEKGAVETTIHDLMGSEIDVFLEEVSEQELKEYEESFINFEKKYEDEQEGRATLDTEHPTQEVSGHEQRRDEVRPSVPEAERGGNTESGDATRDSGETDATAGVRESDRTAAGTRRRADRSDEVRGTTPTDGTAGRSLNEIEADYDSARTVSARAQHGRELAEAYSKLFGLENNTVVAESTSEWLDLFRAAIERTGIPEAMEIYEETVIDIESGAIIQGVMVGDKVLLNAEANANVQMFAEAWLHEQTHEADRGLFSVDEFNAMNIPSINKHIPVGYHDLSKATRISEAIAFAVQALHRNHSIEAIASGDVNMRAIHKDIRGIVGQTLNRLTNGQSYIDFARPEHTDAQTGGQKSTTDTTRETDTGHERSRAAETREADRDGARRDTESAAREVDIESLTDALKKEGEATLSDHEVKQTNKQQQELEDLLKGLADDLGIDDVRFLKGEKKQPARMTGEAWDKVTRINDLLIQQGHLKYEDYARVFVNAMGDQIKPYLRSFYMMNIDLNAEVEGLSSMEEVISFDLDNIKREEKKAEKKTEPLQRKPGETPQDLARRAQKELKFNEWRHRWSASNAVRIYPYRVGSKFSASQMQQIKDWSRAHGFEWGSASKDTAIHLYKPNKMSANEMESILNSNNMEKVHREKAEKAERQKTEKREKKKAKAETRDSNEWIVSVFGADAMNAHNMNALSDYLEGKADKFDGLINNKWRNGIEKLDAFTPDGSAVDFKKLKRLYEQHKESQEKITDAAAEVDTAPTEGQKKAGNYKKGHVRVNGFDVTIENPQGSERSGTNSEGRKWSITMNNHYGYFKRTEAIDGDHVDVFLGDNLNSEKIFVVDQVNPESREFDENKVMMGFDSIESARDAYLSNYEKGWQGLGEITEVSLDTFKDWLYRGSKQQKPFSEYKSVKLDQMKQQLTEKEAELDEARKAHQNAVAKHSRLRNKMKDDAQLGNAGQGFIGGGFSEGATGGLFDTQRDTQLTNARQIVAEAKKEADVHADRVNKLAKEVEKLKDDIVNKRYDQQEIFTEQEGEIPISPDGKYQIYKYNSGSREFYAIPTAENKGERSKYDDLATTIEEAIETANFNRQAEAESERRKKEAETEKKAAEEAEEARKKDNEGKTPAQIMQEARINKILDTKINFKGRIITRRQFVEEYIEAGYKPEIERVHAIADKTNKQWNRMDAHEQRAFEKKRKEAGMKNQYQLVSKDGYYQVVTKTEYDYAQSILNEQTKQDAKAFNNKEQQDGRQDSETSTEGTEARPERVSESEQLSDRGVPTEDTRGDSESKQIDSRDSSDKSGAGFTYDVNKKYTNEEIADVVSTVTEIRDGEVIITGEITDDIRSLVSHYESGGVAKQDRGVLDEYYTGEKLVDATGELIKPLLPKGVLDVLEPSVGIGNFLRAVPDNSNVTSFEINETTAAITKILNPDATVNVRSFETEFIDDIGRKKPFTEQYDVVIGNPPYGNHRGLYKGLGELPRIARYEDYFVKRSVDVLKDGGILAMVLPSSWMDRHQRPEGYRIVNAYRLPSGAFEATQVGTDIVILQKENGYKAEADHNYFEQHPDKVLGEEKERRGRFGDMEKYIEGSVDKAIEQIREDAAKDIAKELSIEPTQDNIEEIRGAVEETATKEGAKAIIKEEQKAKKPAEEKKPVPKRKQKKAAQPVKGKVRLTPSQLKYEFKKGDEVVPSAKQFDNVFTESESDAFKDANYEGILSNPEAHKEHANYIDGQWMHDFYYTEGNIYGRLEQLERDKANMDEAQYEKQKKLLEDVLPEKKELDEINLTPNTAFAKNLIIIYKNGNGETVSLQQMFKNFVMSLPYEAFGSSGKWEVMSYIDNEQVHGRDRQRNQLVRERRKEVGNRLFQKFLQEELVDTERKKIVHAFNREYNAIHRPDYSKVPMFSSINNNFYGRPLKLTEVQLAGVGRMTVKGVGLLAHEVGFGKTLSGILSMHEAMERGFTKKPLLVVPNQSILEQWVETIQEVLPESTVNVLGNLGVNYDLTDFEVNDKDITIVTYQGFKKLGFNGDTYDKMAQKFSYITEDLNDHKKKNVRDEAKEDAAAEVVRGKMQRGGEYSFEDMGFDYMVFDEVHNANHIVGKVRIDKGQHSDFRQQSQRPSDLGIKTWLASQYIQDMNNGRNVLLLSATPFTNKPLEYYSVLSLVANSTLERMGFFNVDQFFETFMEADTDWEMKADGTPVQKMNVRRFRNNGLFNQLIGEFIDIKGEEDNPSLVRPERTNKEYKAPQNELFEQTMEGVQGLMANHETLLKGLTEARQAAFSPFAAEMCPRIPTDHIDFVENSPKIDATMKLVGQNLKDNPGGGQIIYSEVGIDYFPMMKEYIVEKLGLKDKEVRIISGATSAAERARVQKGFNDGGVKVVIGSPAIKEGMNLQKNTTDMYILSLPYNFTQLRQVEGRGWRQGNRWKNIRINFMLTDDSADVFLLQRLQIKQGLYNEAMKHGSESVDVGDINAGDLKTDLISDPTVRAHMEVTQVKEQLNSEKEQITSDLAFVTRKFEAYREAVKKIEQEKRHVEWYKERAKDNPDSYWVTHLPAQEKKVEAAMIKLAEEAEKLEKQGVNVTEIETQQALAEKGIAEIEEKLSSLEQREGELIEKYTKEAEEKQKLEASIIDEYVRERHEENKAGYYETRDASPQFLKRQEIAEPMGFMDRLMEPKSMLSTSAEERRIAWHEGRLSYKREGKLWQAYMDGKPLKHAISDNITTLKGLMYEMSQSDMDRWEADRRRQEKEAEQQTQGIEQSESGLMVVDASKRQDVKTEEAEQVGVDAELREPDAETTRYNYEPVNILLEVAGRRGGEDQRHNTSRIGETFYVEKPVLNAYNLYRSLYGIGSLLRPVRKLKEQGLLDMVGDTGKLDREKVWLFADNFRLAINDYERALMKAKHIATEAAQREIDTILREVEYAKEYYKRLAQHQGDPHLDVLRELRAPRFLKQTAENRRTQERAGMNRARFLILGEKGAEGLDAYDAATRRMDNLGAAKMMEEAGKDAKAIRLSTGWERGADGKWRYETSGEMVAIPAADKIRDARVADVLGEDSKLLKAYPQLNVIDVVFVNNPAEHHEGGYNREFKFIEINHPAYSSIREYQREIEEYESQLSEQKDAHNKERLNNLIAHKKGAIERANNNLLEDRRETIIHEIQHAVQDIEGFEHGGNLGSEGEFNRRIEQSSELKEVSRQIREHETIRRWNERKPDASIEELKALRAEAHNNAEIKELMRKSDEILGRRSDLGMSEFYRRLAGETEARNAARRMDMTADQIRNTLLEATEDVAREDQIMIRDGFEHATSLAEQKEREVRFLRQDNLYNNLEGIDQQIEDYNGLLSRVLNNSRNRKEVLSEARASGMNLRNAIESYIAEKASMEEIDQIAKDMGVPEMADGAVRYMFWREANPDDGSARWKAKNALKLREYQNDILFLKDGTPIRDDALAEYEKRVRGSRGALKSGSIDGFLFGLEEGWFDRMASLRILQDAIVQGKDIPDTHNAYMLENQLSSRNQAQEEQYRQKYLDPISQKAGELFGDIKEIDRYLIAKHGLERNLEMARRQIEKESEPIYNALEMKRLMGEIDNETFEEKVSIQAQKDEAKLEKYIISKDYSGLTALYVDIFGNEAEDAGSYTETVYNAMNRYIVEIDNEKDTKGLWKLINDATKYMLKRQFDSGMMTRENYERVRDMYQYYVPLRGFDEVVAGEMYDYLVTRDTNFNRVLRKAHGRKSLSESPLVSLMSMGQSGVMEVNRNDMKKAFFRLVATNPSNIATIKDVWYVLSEDGLWNERHPEIPANASGEQVADIVEQFEKEMLELSLEDKAKRGRNRLDVRAKITKSQAAEHAVKVWVNGEEKIIYVNGNPRAAQALNGLTNPAGKERSGVIRSMHYLMRQMSANFTSRNPEFLITNGQRDINYAISSAAIKEGTRYAAQLAGNATRVGPTIAANLWGDGKADGKYQKYWEEFTWNGGETGYAVLHSDDANRKYINKQLRKFSNRKDPLLPFRVWAEQVENANRMIEANTRFAAYVTSRQDGRTIERSIADAKDISVNFNRKGSGDYWASAVHDLLLFSNPALQSMRQMGLMAKDHTGKFAGVISISMLAGYMMPIMNKMLISMFGDDEDDEKYRNLSEWTKYNHMVVYVPGSKDKFVSYALSHEMRGFHGLGVLAYEAANGELRGRNGAGLVLEQFADNLPLDPTGGRNTFMIDVLKPLYEAYITNENFMGRPIYKESTWNEGAPEWTKAYPKTPAAITDLSKWLNEVSGGDEVVPGWANFNPARLHHVFNGYVGGAWTTYSDALSQIYGAITGDEESKNIFNAPIARKIVRTSDETNRQMRINNEYYYWMDWLNEYNRVERGYKRISRDRQRDLDERAGYRNKHIDIKRDKDSRRIHKEITKMKKKIEKAEERGQDERALEMKNQLVDDLWNMVQSTD